MRSKLLIAVVCLLVGAGGMLLITSGPLVLVKAECPTCLGVNYDPWETRPCGNGDVNGDGSFDMADAVYILQYLFAQGPKPKTLPCGLPATGQTTCRDSDASVIDCTNQDYPGQDGFYQAGCSMQGRFVDNGDGSVTDRCTGLMWQKETAPGTYDWQQALHYCENLTLAGHTDWRVPNIRELESIVDYGRYDPAIDPVFGTVSESGWYWSSTPDVYYPNHAWLVDFQNGHASYSYVKNYGDSVRAVRSGP